MSGGVARLYRSPRSSGEGTTRRNASIEGSAHENQCPQPAGRHSHRGDRPLHHHGRPAAQESEGAGTVNQVLEWNQIFIDTLIATNTANSSSQRLGAIVHTAIFDAYNGIERRYVPVFVDRTAPRGASRRAAVIAAAYPALVGIFPSLSRPNGRR